MIKVEITIRRDDANRRERMTGLATDLGRVNEEAQLGLLEQLFNSVLISLYEDKYNLIEITERE